MDFYSELGEGAKEMLKQAREMEEKEKDREKKKGSHSPRGEQSRGSSATPTKKKAASSKADEAFATYVRELERRDKLEGMRERKKEKGEREEKKVVTPRIQFSDADGDPSVQRSTSEDKIKQNMNKNSRVLLSKLPSVAPLINL